MSASLLKSTRLVARNSVQTSAVRGLSSVVLRASVKQAVRIGAQHNRPTSATFANMTSNAAFQSRQYSVIETDVSAPTIDFSKMKEIASSSDPKYVIVDVREPDEYSAGHIPNAINIPCKSSPGALGLDPEEFKLTFGFDKPSPEKTLVFYCLAGVRARMSEELAATFGYEHRLNYVGSFKDWLDNHGEIAVPAKAAETAAAKDDATAKSASSSAEPKKDA